MADSLLLNDIELNASPIWLSTGFDLGSPQADTVAISRLLVDGQVLTGDRASNRELTIPVHIMTGTRAHAVQLVEQIVKVVNSRAYTLTWTPQDGQAVVFDCFRGQVKQEWSISEQRQGLILLTLHIPALPWTRPPAPVTITTGSTSSVAIDAFENTTGLTVNGSATTTSNHIEGSQAVAETISYTVDTTSSNYTVAADGSKLYPIPPVDFSFSRAVSLNLTGYTTVVSNWSGFGTNYGPASYSLTLSSSGGSKTWKASNVQAGPNSTSWYSAVFDLTAAAVSSTGTLNLSAVSSYALTFTFTGYAAGSGTASVTTDDLRAYPPLAGGITGPSTALGLSGISGTARTPATITISANQPVKTVLLARAPNPRTGFVPKLKPTGTVTTGATSAYDGDIYGQTDGLGGYIATYQVRAGAVNGTYLIVSRMSFQSTTTETITVRASAGGVVYQTITRTFLAGTDYTPGPNSYELFVLGELTLPPLDVPAANYGSLVTITVGPSGANGVQHDELYLLDRAGESFLLKLPTAASYFQIVPPDPGGFGSQIFAGSNADGSDWLSVLPYVVGQGAISLNPGSANLLVVLDPGSGSSTFVTSATLSASFYPRYFAGRG